MAVPVAADLEQGTGRGAAKGARAEGYVALFCLIPSLVVPLLPPLPQPVDVAIGVLFWVCWACAWLFAISGVRRGRGGARTAAFISLVILVLHAALILIIVRH